MVQTTPRRPAKDTRVAEATRVLWDETPITQADFIAISTALTTEGMSYPARYEL